MNQEIAINSYFEIKAHWYPLTHKLFRIVEINTKKKKKTAEKFIVAAS